VTVYDRGEFEKAHARLRSPPAELTMGDIEQLATFSPDLARQPLAARKAALFPEPAPRTQSATHGPIATKNGLSAESIDCIAGSVVWFVKEQFQQQLAPLLRRLDAHSNSGRPVRTTRACSRRRRLTVVFGHEGGRVVVGARTHDATPGRSHQWKLIVKSGEAR
jgi:hypothetical protein